MPKSNHGGRREGAGRPPTGQPRKVVVSATLDADLVESLDAWAKQRSISRSAALQDILRYVFPEKQ